MTREPAARRSRPPRPPTLPATLLREVVARQLASISLRGAAGQIGMSPNALRNFLAGAEPRATTRAKLERWLAARKSGEARPRVGDLVELIGDLTAELSPKQAVALGRDTTRFLLGAYQERHRSPPRWVRELAHYYRATRSR